MKLSTISTRIQFISLGLVFAFVLIFSMAQAAPQAQDSGTAWEDPTATPTADDATSTPVTATETATTAPTETVDPTATAEATVIATQTVAATATSTTTTPTATQTTVATTTATAVPTDDPTATVTAVPTDETVEPTATTTVEATATATTEPTTEPTATATATDEPTADFIVEVEGPSTVTVGDTFDVSVVAKNVPDPGIFGYQFEFNWDDTVVSPVDDTLSLNDSFGLQAQRDISTDQLSLAVSRQGDVDDLGGDLTLLTWTFQADAVTDPDATTFSLSDWKFGRKGGVVVLVDQVIDLDVIIEEIDDTAGNGDIVGNITVEGRADDNQAGHEVTAIANSTASDITDDAGDFWINDAPADTYTVTANSAGFLSTTCTDVAHSVDALTTLNNTTLLAGDIDDDGVIDITDATAIGTAFGSTEADEVANLNVDDEVDILDLILMAANYGQTSADNPWSCQ